MTFANITGVTAETEVAELMVPELVVFGSVASETGGEVADPPTARDRWRVAQGVVTAAAYSLLLAGSNSITPLIPIYRGVLGFSPLMMSLTFVCYVSVLTVVLLALAHPALVRLAPQMICAAMVLGFVSDMLLAEATAFGVLAGRAVAGVSIGLGIGAASALVVAAMGSGARSISATGNMVGAVLGTVTAQVLVAVLGVSATSWNFVLHGIACLLVTGMLAGILWKRRRVNPGLLHHEDGAVAGVGARLKTQLREHTLALTVGCMAWVAVGSTLVYLPAYFGELGLNTVKAGGVIAFLLCSAAGQLASPWLTKTVPWARGVGAMAAGIAMLLAGGQMHRPLLAMAGFALFGLGTGVAYRLGLVLFCHGASPAEHGARSSLYAAVTYCATAVTTLVMGAVGNRVGLRHMVVLLFGLLAASCAMLVGRAPRLGEALE